MIQCCVMWMDLESLKRLELEYWSEPEIGSASESESEREVESESEAEEDSRTPPPWELKDINDVELNDVELSDLSMYDNHPLPVCFFNKHIKYKNQAMKDVEKAEAEYEERVRDLPDEGPWDAVPPRDNLRRVGGVRPYEIREQDRPRFIHYCELSLIKYNAENQGANFVFHELVKATSPVSCPLYYITFLAKDASNNDADVSTFQTEVGDKVVPNPLEAKVILCKMKPN